MPHIKIVESSELNPELSLRASDYIKEALKRPPVYVRNIVVHSSLTDSYYFVPKAKVIGENRFEVVGKKINVTESVRALIEAKRKPPSKKKVRANDI